MTEKAWPFFGFYKFCCLSIFLRFLAVFCLLFQQVILIKAALTTHREPSPHTGKPDTIYTKLRNEISHRTNAGTETTRAEIMNHLDEFRRIVHKAVKSKIYVNFSSYPGKCSGRATTCFGSSRQSIRAPVN